MADAKISELTALTAAADADLFAIVDSSATETKKITRQNLLGSIVISGANVGIGVASPTATLDVNGTITTRASGTEGGQVNFWNPNNLSTGLTVDVSSVVDTARIFQIRNNSQMQIGQLAGTGGNVTLHTGGSERVRINSVGNVGIGVVPKVWHSSYDVLQIGSGGSLAASTTNESRVFLQANAYTNASNVQTYLSTDEASQYWQNGGTHIFNVAPSGTADTAISWTTAMTIDNAGNVGINVSDPTHKLEVVKDNTYAAKFGGDGGGSDFSIEIGQSGTSASPGFNATAGSMKFSIAGSEAMRIDSSENLLVGTTSVGIGDAGIELRADGQITGTRDGNYAALLNRIGSGGTENGDIINLRANGTTVGSIGARSGVVSYIVLDPRSGLKGAALIGGSVDANNGIINPGKADGDIADDAISLGGSSSRFKNLYLSGGVVFGATGGAVTSKTLDDYEEGTWTPADGSGAALTFSTAVGTYTKVGNLVTAVYSVTYPSTADTTDMAVSGLPFAPDTNFIYGGSQSYTNKAAAFDCSVTTVSSKIVYRTGGTSAQIHNNDLSSGSIRGSITYQV